MKNDILLSISMLDDTLRSKKIVIDSDFRNMEQSIWPPPVVDRLPW